MKKVKLKSIMPGRTKMRPTKRSLARASGRRMNKKLVVLGGRKYAVPAGVLSSLMNSLAPHRLQEEELLNFEEFFGKSDLPEWATNLRGLRHREDLTQGEFASAIRIPQSNLSAMEGGKRPIGKELARRIAETFGTDYRHFL